jgi:hypothetical protein
VRRRLRPFLPLIWAGGVVLASWSPLASLLPVLGVLKGPLAAVLLVVAAGVAATRFRDDRPEGAVATRSEPAWPSRLAARPLLLLAIGFVALAAVGLAYTSRLRASGDEPHYLIMAQSLWREGDLDLADNYAREDYQEYTPGPVRPHYGAPRRDGRSFPAHSPGLPVLLAPVYAAAGRAGCVMLLALMAAGVAVAARSLALRQTGSGEAALVAWAAALGPPVFFYAFHVYTEVPSALCVALALLLLWPAPPTVPSAVGAAFLAAALPWLHVKMAPAAAALAVIALARAGSRARIAFLATAGAMALGFAAYYQAIFGHPSPLAIYGGVPAESNGSPLRAAVGLLLDRSFGLLPHAPVWLLAIAGVVAVRRPFSPRAWPFGLVGAAILAPVLPWRMWWGGQCPPARMLVPLIPVLAVAVAVRCTPPTRGLARWRVALLTLGFALALFASVDPGRLLLLNRGNRPTRLWAALSGPVPIERYLPSLTYSDAAEWRVAVVWTAALVALLVLDRLALTRDGADRLFRGLGLPVVFFLTIGVLVDGWARAGTSATAAPATAPGTPPASDSDAEG